jgi:hypothetical protein
MRFYGYRYKDVINEKAKVFFMLLNEMYKINASEKLEDINIISIPHIKKHDASEIIQRYKMQLFDLDNLADNDDFSSLTTLKQNL